MRALLLVSLGILAGYGYLMFRDNRRLLRKLLATTGPKEWIVGIYLVFGLELVTAGVYFVPSVPDPNALPVFQSGLDAWAFGVSWGIMFFLATISYGLFLNRRYPELYLLGLLIFLGAFSLTFYPLLHSDFGSQFIQGLLVVGIMAILSVDHLAIGRYVYQSIWMLSHIVLIGFMLWSLITGTAVYFRFEPKPAKAVLYTGFVMLGAAWFYFEGLVASGRQRKGHPPNSIEFPVPSRREAGEDALQVVSSPVQSPVTTQSVSISANADWIPLLKLYCLGPFRLVPGEDPMDDAVLKSNQKPLEILKLIAISPGREVSRDRLIDVLWEDSPGDKATVNFQKALSRLRALVDSPALKSNKASYVLARGSSYALHPEYTWVDIEEFVASTNIGHRYRQDGVDHAAISAFEKASEIWRGPLLEGQAPAPWVAHERKRLEEISSTLHLEAAKLFINKGNFAMAERWIKKGLAVNSDSEQAVRIMALAQYEQGKKSDALKSLEDFTARLKKILQTEPSPKTVKLRGMIRTDRKISPAEWI
jgi:DNA-binding SARP family transcriptional activator